MQLNRLRDALRLTTLRPTLADSLPLFALILLIQRVIVNEDLKKSPLVLSPKLLGKIGESTRGPNNQEKGYRFYPVAYVVEGGSVKRDPV